MLKIGHTNIICEMLYVNFLRAQLGGGKILKMEQKRQLCISYVAYQVVIVNIFSSKY